MRTRPAAGRRGCRGPDQGTPAADDDTGATHADVTREMVQRQAEHELSTNWFGRTVARRPKSVLLVTGLTTLTLSALGPILLENNITAGTEGFEPRGSLLADRQLQNRLVDQLSHTPARNGGDFGRRRQQLLHINTTVASERAKGVRRRQQAATLASLTCADNNGNDRCEEILDVIYECTGAGCRIATASAFHAICGVEDDIRALEGFGGCCERTRSVGADGAGVGGDECCSPRSLPRIAEMLYGVECAAITDEQAVSTFDSVVQCGNLQGQIAEERQASACSRLGPFASTAKQIAEWGTTPTGTMSRSAFCLAGSAWEDWMHEGIVVPAMDAVLRPTHEGGGLQGGKLLVASWGSQRMRDQLQNESLNGDVVLANFVGFV